MTDPLSRVDWVTFNCAGYYLEITKALGTSNERTTCGTRQSGITS